MNETVVTFKNGKRVISMYFTESSDKGLDMRMTIDPEWKPDEEPDLPMLLASTLMNSLNMKSEDASNPQVYAGQD